MNKPISAFRQEVQDLQTKSFTDELTYNKIMLDETFNKLNIKLSSDNYYDNGEIMNAIVDLTEANRDILLTLIKDFDSYNKLVDLQYSSNKKENQIDLNCIIHFAEEVYSNEILWDRNEEVFYYNV